MFEQSISIAECPGPSEFDSLDPTPEEIRTRSAEIRRGWSERVTKKRKVCGDGAWRLPFVMTYELVRQLDTNQE